MQSKTRNRVGERLGELRALLGEFRARRPKRVLDAYGPAPRLISVEFLHRAAQGLGEFLA